MFLAWIAFSIIKKIVRFFNELWDMHKTKKFVKRYGGSNPFRDDTVYIRYKQY